MLKYNEDLDYVITGVDISKTELEDIIVETDKTIYDNDSGIDKLIEAYLKKVQCLHKLDKFAESKESLDKLLDLSPNMPEAHVHLGIFYREKKEYDKAINCINKAIEVNPDYAYAYLIRGYVKMSLSDYCDEIEDFTKVIELKPNYATAYNNRGIIYRNKGDLDCAIENFEKAIEINSNFDRARDNRLKAYHAKDDNLTMPLTKIRKNQEYMEALKKDIKKVVPFLCAGASKPYGYYTWKGLLTEVFIICCRYDKIDSEDKKNIEKNIADGDYIAAASEMDRIFPNIISAVCTAIESIADANCIRDVKVNSRSILSEYLHLFPNETCLTTRTC